MSATTPEFLMLGTSAASAACCLGRSALSSALARGLAIAMLGMMLATVFIPSSALIYLPVLAVITLSTGMATLALRDEGPRVDLHRAAGGWVMALAAAMHHHAGAGSGMATHDHVVMGVVVVLTIAYLSWTAWILARKPLLLRGSLGVEHVMMASAAAVMVFGM